MSRKSINIIVKIITLICMMAAIGGIALPFIARYYIIRKLNFELDFNSVASIGVIGGSDGPTSILIEQLNPNFMVITFLAIVWLVGVIYLNRTKMK